jgi:hypothetical protein
MTMSDLFDDDDNHSWRPPTEAEKKILEARRERSNKVKRGWGGETISWYLINISSKLHFDLKIQEFAYARVIVVIGLFCNRHFLAKSGRIRLHT